MKKFVGNVNGKTFNDEKEFNAAATEAMKSNDGTLSISSYYSYSDDNVLARREDVKKELTKIDTKRVERDDYVLTNQKPNQLFGGKVLNYDLSTELTERLSEASNKEEIKQTSLNELNKSEKSISNYTDQVKYLQNEIEKLQDDLYKKEEDLKDFKAKKRYYSTIVDSLGGVEVEDSKDDEPEPEPEHTEVKENTKSVTNRENDDWTNNDLFSDFASFLRFIKFF